MKTLLKTRFIFLALLIVPLINISCEDEDHDQALKVDANFGFTTAATNSLSVEFVNQSEGADAFLWDMGDGSETSSELNPVHLYSEPGEYVVTLIASKGEVRDTLKKTIPVELKKIVESGFEHNPKDDNDEDDGKTIFFTNLTKGAVDYTWDLGDGVGTSKDPDPVYTYAEYGMVTVKLIATDGEFTDEVEKSFMVKPNMKAEFEYSVEETKVTFKNKSKKAESYRWDFGDGNTSDEENPEHTYGDFGLYEVTLTVKNEYEEIVYVKDVAIADPSYVNVALDKKVKFSTEYNSKSTGEKAVDGDKTKKSSRWMTKRKDASPQWLEIDFGAETIIGGLNIFSDKYYPVDFVLQYRDGTKWIDATTVTGNNSNDFLTVFKPQTTTKVRLYITGFSKANDAWLKIYEVEVLGKVVE